jgi:tight adherence protein C
MLIALIVGTVFGSVALLIFGLSRRTSSALESRLDDFRDRAAMPEGEENDLAIPFATRILKPGMEGMARAFGSILPASILTNIEKQLVTAGSLMTLNTFVAIWAACTIFMTGFVLFAVITVGMAVGPIQAVMVLAFGMIGLMLPRIWLRGKVKSRQKAVIRSLPDALDLVTVCVEAGLGLDAALARVADKSSGPLPDEISRMLVDVAMGKLRRDALMELTERLEVDELTSFINSVVQAEQLGVSVSQVLRVQADQLRTRRRQKAEKSAHEAAIKMLIPLVLFIFPAFILVILGPAGIRLTESLGG